MKNNKKAFLWIAGVAAVVILILLLSLVIGSKAAQRQTEQTQTESLPSTDGETQAEETTAPAQTTEATEDTQPTEETEPEETEPKETESTTPPNGGNSQPGGSGGYDPTGGDYDDGTGSKDPEVEVPEAGSAGNPYVEMLTEYPGTVTSVNLPEGSAVHYLLTGSAGSVITIEDPDAQIVFGETTCTPDESGVLTLNLSETASDAVILLKNVGEVEASFVLSYQEAPGGKTNPVVLEDVSQIDVSLKAEDADGCYYLWTATTTGHLTLTPQQENLEILVTVGENTFQLSESKDGAVACPIVKGEDVLIQVVAAPDEAGSYPEIRTVITGTVDADPGTEENPLPETLTKIPGSFTTGKIPAGGQVFYSVSGVNGTILTLDSADAAVLYGDTVFTPDEENRITVDLASGEEEAALLGVENRGTVPAYFTLKFAWPLGSEGNPEALESIDTVEASLSADCLEGYWFTWTAEEAGTVQFAATEVTPADAGYDVGLRKAGTETETLLSESEDGILRLDVTAGDTILLRVTALPDGEGNYSGIRVTLYGTVTDAPGSEENPILIADPMKAETVTVGANETVYVTGFFHEMAMTISNATGASITFEDETYEADKGTIRVEFPKASGMGRPMPQTFTLFSRTKKTFTLTFAYPVGHQQNPAELVMGSNTADVKENADGFFYTWTADCDGELTIAMDADAQWQYCVNNLTTSHYGDTRSSADSANIETVEVSAGDEIQIMVNTFDPEDMFHTPDGTVTVTASFFDPLLGTEEKPIALAEKDSFTVPAGKSVYYTGGAEGMVMELKGSVACVSCGGTEYTPVDGVLTLTCVGAKPVFCIIGSGEEDVECTVSFAYPLGHEENPEELVLGENEAALEEGNPDGYTFAWTADSTGELTITMDPEACWQYCVCNETEETRSGTVTSAEEDEPYICTVTVTEGDRILITVNTFDPEMPGTTPAGKVVFTASFVDSSADMKEILLEESAAPEKNSKESEPEENTGDPQPDET